MSRIEYPYVFIFMIIFDDRTKGGQFFSSNVISWHIVLRIEMTLFDVLYPLLNNFQTFTKHT